MSKMNLKLITIKFCLVCLTVSFAQTISESYNSFSIKLLQKVIKKHKYSNIALSPFPIWCFFGLIQEEMLNISTKPMNNLLHISENGKNFTSDYKKLFKILWQNVDEVDMETDRITYLNYMNQLKNKFQKLTKDLNNTIEEKKKSSRNKTVSKKNYSNGKIKELFLDDDMDDLDLALRSILNFKARWEFSVDNINEMTRGNFYSKNSGKTIICNAHFMTQTNTFSITLIEELKAIAVELKTENAMSLILLLPQKGLGVKHVLKSMHKIKIEDIVKKLMNKYTEQMLNVILPKFNIINTIDINEILYDMDMANIFEEKKIYLQLATLQRFYNLNVIQNTEITVKKGTSADIKNILNENSNVYFSKPFLYFIVNKVNNTILLAGQVTNPSMTMDV